MIELIIAMVLLAIALAVVSRTILDGIGSAGGARAGSVSDAAVARTLSLLTADVSAAESADRRDGLVRDPAEFAVALRTGSEVRSTNPSDGNRVLDIDDVVAGSPSEFRLQVDVAPAAGVECVTWRAVTESSKFIIRRLVDPAGGCGGGSIERRDLVSVPTPVKDIDTTPFSYRLICSPKAGGDCPGRPGGNSCKFWSADAVNNVSRRWVVGIDVHVMNVTKDTSASRTTGSTNAAVRSRETISYRTALGC